MPGRKRFCCNFGLKLHRNGFEYCVWIFMFSFLYAHGFWGKKSGNLWELPKPKKTKPKNKPMWKPQQLVDRNCFSLWHIMSNREHAMWNTKHAMWNKKHVICKHIPYFEKWPNVSWMEPWLRNLTEPNVSWMEPWLRNLSEPNISWMEPSLRNPSKPNVSWMNLHFGTSRNLTFHEWNLHFGTSRNLTFHEWNLHFGTSRNLTCHEWNLHFGISRNLTCHEWNLHFGTSRNLTFHERNLWLRNLSEPNLSWMEPSLRNRFHSFGTSRNLVQGFGRLPQTTPKLYWKNPNAFQAVGEKPYP